MDATVALVEKVDEEEHEFLLAEEEYLHHGRNLGAHDNRMTLETHLICCTSRTELQRVSRVI